MTALNPCDGDAGFRHKEFGSCRYDLNPKTKTGSIPYAVVPLFGLQPRDLVLSEFNRALFHWLPFVDSSHFHPAFDLRQVEKLETALSRSGKVMLII